jgi:Flp pilus assembly protein TadB
VTHTDVGEYAQPMNDRLAGRANPADAEAAAISRAATVIATVLIVVAGVFAYLGLLQVSALALLGALSASIASVAGRRERRLRWLAPAMVAAVLITVVIASDFVGS